MMFLLTDRCFENLQSCHFLLKRLLTQFQQLCYQTLKNQVPAGKVITYARLAKLIGNPKAYRAVGNAMNKNPFAPEIPCHRVVKANGDLGGFAYDIGL
jgi:methylated-DNA-[protein]-cysteine S-methyltransferase